MHPVPRDTPNFPANRAVETKRHQRPDHPAPRLATPLGYATVQSRHGESASHQTTRTLSQFAVAHGPARAETKSTAPEPPAPDLRSLDALQRAIEQLPEDGRLPRSTREAMVSAVVRMADQDEAGAIDAFAQMVTRAWGTGEVVLPRRQADVPSDVDVPLKDIEGMATQIARDAPIGIACDLTLELARLVGLARPGRENAIRAAVLPLLRRLLPDAPRPRAAGDTRSLPITENMDLVLAKVLLKLKREASGRPLRTDVLDRTLAQLTTVPATHLELVFEFASWPDVDSLQGTAQSKRPTAHPESERWSQFCDRLLTQADRLSIAQFEAVVKMLVFRETELAVPAGTLLRETRKHAQKLTPDQLAVIGMQLGAADAQAQHAAIGKIKRSVAGIVAIGADIKPAMTAMMVGAYLHGILTSAAIANPPPLSTLREIIGAQAAQFACDKTDPDKHKALTWALDQGLLMASTPETILSISDTEADGLDDSARFFFLRRARVSRSATTSAEGRLEALDSAAYPPEYAHWRDEFMLRTSVVSDPAKPNALRITHGALLRTLAAADPGEGKSSDPARPVDSKAAAVRPIPPPSLRAMVAIDSVLDFYEQVIPIARTSADDKSFASTTEHGTILMFHVQAKEFAQRLKQPVFTALASHLMSRADIQVNGISTGDSRLIDWALASLRHFQRAIAGGLPSAIATESLHLVAMQICEMVVHPSARARHFEAAAQIIGGPAASALAIKAYVSGVCDALLEFVPGREPPGLLGEPRNPEKNARAAMRALCLSLAGGTTLPDDALGRIMAALRVNKDRVATMPMAWLIDEVATVVAANWNPQRLDILCECLEWGRPGDDARTAGLAVLLTRRPRDAEHAEALWDAIVPRLVHQPFATLKLSLASLLAFASRAGTDPGRLRDVFIAIASRALGNPIAAGPTREHLLAALKGAAKAAGMTADQISEGVESAELAASWIAAKETSPLPQGIARAPR